VLSVEECCKLPVGDDARALPKLDAFDEEFGREEAGIVDAPPPNPAFRLRTFIGLALAAGAITALALGWSAISSAPSSEETLQRATSSASSEKADETISRLRRELEALREENNELAQARQQAAETIASLQAGEQESRRSFTSWYSDVGALTYGIPSQGDGTVIGRRSSARAKPREAPRRDDGGPVSVEAPQ
jgi:FtsZ-binding cell division protein ZapB